MKNRIEIYIRQSGGSGTLLNFHIPNNLREKFIEGLKNGAFECEAGSANIEISVLPEWITDPEQRGQLLHNDNPIHMRTCINTINILSDE